MFRRDTPVESHLRMEVRSWLEANLPLALRGRTARPPPAELMPWYQALSRKGWIAPHWRTAAACARSQSHRSDPHGVWDRGAEGAASAADPCGDCDLGTGLLGAWRGL